MKSKLIDIICPIYNQEKHISKFLLSLFNLDFDNINIILVDDGSTDRTASIINEVMSENVDKAFFTIKKIMGELPRLETMECYMLVLNTFGFAIQMMK